MTSTYIIIGLLFVSITIAIVAWFASSQDSSLEYDSSAYGDRIPEEKRVIHKRKRRRKRKKISDDVWRQRLHAMIMADPSKRIRKSILNTKGGWSVQRQNDFLIRNSDLFSVKKNGNGTYIFLK